MTGLLRHLCLAAGLAGSFGFVRVFAAPVPLPVPVAPRTATSAISIHLQPKVQADACFTLLRSLPGVSRELCAQALGYTLPVELSFGLVAHTHQALPATRNIVIKTGLKGIVVLAP